MEEAPIHPPLRRKGRDVHVYFDNDAEGRTPHDARGLIQRIDGLPRSGA